MRNGAPKPAKGSTTPNSKKRKCEDIELQDKPSRPTKSRRVVKSYQQGDGPSRIETLPSEIQHEIYREVLQGINDKVEAKPIRSTPPSPSSLIAKLQDKGSPKLSNVTSILRVSKKTNLEAAQAFYDTVARPVRVRLSDVIYAANEVYRSIYGVVTCAKLSIVRPARQIDASHAHRSQ